MMRKPSRLLYLQLLTASKNEKGSSDPNKLSRDMINCIHKQKCEVIKKFKYMNNFKLFRTVIIKSNPRDFNSKN